MRVTQPILGWLHCGKLNCPGSADQLSVTQPILGWLHCGSSWRSASERPDHPAGPRLAPLRQTCYPAWSAGTALSGRSRPATLRQRGPGLGQQVCVIRLILGWLHCGRRRRSSRDRTRRVIRPVPAGSIAAMCNPGADRPRAGPSSGRSSAGSIAAGPTRQGPARTWSPGRSLAGSIADLPWRPGVDLRRAVIRPILGWPHCGGTLKKPAMLLRVVIRPRSRSAPLRHAVWGRGRAGWTGQPADSWLAPLRQPRPGKRPNLRGSSSRSLAGSSGDRRRRVAGPSKGGHPANSRLAPLRHPRDRLRHRVLVRHPAGPWLAPLRCDMHDRDDTQRVRVIQPIPGWLHRGMVAAPHRAAMPVVIQPIYGWPIAALGLT